MVLLLRVPSTLIALTTSLLLPLTSATTASSPVCVSSSEGYVTGQVNYLYNNFCQVLANNGFASDTAVYGLPIISFSYVATGAGIGGCDQDNCLSSFKTLVGSCGLANNTIWGTGSLNAGCGTYNYTIWNSDSISLGQATTTLVGATMTTAATIPSATPTSASSTSSEPTLIENLPSTTAITSSSSIEPSDISNSLVLGTSSVYANSTSSAKGVSTTGKGYVVVASGTSTVGAQATGKPDVGSTALGTSGGDVVRVGVVSLVGLAAVFAAFF